MIPKSTDLTGVKQGQNQDVYLIQGGETWTAMLRIVTTHCLGVRSWHGQFCVLLNASVVSILFLSSDKGSANKPIKSGKCIPKFCHLKSSKTKTALDSYNCSSQDRWPLVSSSASNRPVNGRLRRGVCCECAPPGLLGGRQHLVEAQTRGGQSGRA